MTYGFRPENWSTFHAELDKRGIAFADIEKVELRPEIALRRDMPGQGAPTGFIQVTVTLRSGQVESWRQSQTEGA